MIADGGITGLERVFALHCDPNLEVGKVGFRAGPITAGADRLHVTMRGPGGHTARPRLSPQIWSTHSVRSSPSCPPCCPGSPTRGPG